MFEISSACKIEGDGIDLQFTGRADATAAGRNRPRHPELRDLHHARHWRGTEGTVTFTEPLHRYGSMIDGG